MNSLGKSPYAVLRCIICSLRRTQKVRLSPNDLRALPLELFTSLYIIKVFHHLIEVMIIFREN